jgi:transposase InsO family protein
VPICRVLPIAPSTYHDHLAKRADPARLSDRARRDEALRPEILRIFEENWRVYGVGKVWRQLSREGFDIARCTVARLMKSMGIQGIIRGKPHRTTKMRILRHARAREATSQQKRQHGVTTA